MADPAPTAGPWSFYKGHPTDPDITVGSRETYTVAKVPDAPAPKLHAQARADARLIAAAPDLLAALVFIVNDQPNGPGEDAELTAEGYNRACAAIAKAKGGA